MATTIVCVPMASYSSCMSFWKNALSNIIYKEIQTTAESTNIKRLYCIHDDIGSLQILLLQYAAKKHNISAMLLRIGGKLSCFAQESRCSSKGIISD